MENAADFRDMTMSDSEENATASAAAVEKLGPESGVADAQEVNKAKDPAADGGGSLMDILKMTGENCSVDDTVSQEKQSPTKSKNKRGISFPSDTIVSGYCEPPDPWKTGKNQSWFNTGIIPRVYLLADINAITRINILSIRVVFQLHNVGALVFKCTL
jgi:hypothetical protein